MLAENSLILCVCAVIVQIAAGQYFGRFGTGLGYPGFGFGLGYGLGRSLGYGGLCGLSGNNYLGTCDLNLAGSLAASHGGGLVVFSSSLPPTGLGVTSENVYEGTVEICGNIPFLGTAEIAGEFATVGAGGINYGCGDGAVGIASEAGLGYAGFGYGVGYDDAGYGCGCGLY